MVPDPRVFPPSAEAEPASRTLHDIAQRSLEASTGVVRDACERELASGIAAILDTGDGGVLERMLASSPSVASYRHLWRAIVTEVERAPAAGLRPVPFALPIVIVAGSEDADEHPVEAIVDAPDALVAILVEHGALNGNRHFTLSNALCAADSIDIAALPALLRAMAPAESDGPLAPIDLAPAAWVAMPGGERVHLRFLVGSALAASTVALCGDTRIGTWGVPFTRALSRALATPETSIVAMPRAPQSLPAAVANGRQVQREAGAALFVSNAVRRLRASVGEPVAVISAHRAADAPAGGEIRLSLSSPFAPREAEGFRCPLHPLDRVADVVAMLAQLAEDCRITDVRMLSGIHPDRDASTGLTLLFKPGTLPPGAEVLAQ
ncbi:MAG: hypothetical protein ABI585_12310 [Betaproteobacteria bacterium]